MRDSSHLAKKHAA